MIPPKNYVLRPKKKLGAFGANETQTAGTPLPAASPVDFVTQLKLMIAALPAAPHLLFGH